MGKNRGYEQRLGPWSLVLGPWSLAFGPWSLVVGLLSLFLGCESNPTDSPSSTESVASVNSQSPNSSPPKPAVKPSDRKTTPLVDKPDERWTQLNATHGSAGKVVRRDQSGKCYFEKSVSDFC